MYVLRDYFTALTATALIGVVALSITKNDKINKIIQLLIGLLLILVLFKPIKNLDIQNISQSISESFQKEFHTYNYESIFQEKLREQIQTTTETYIREKAEQLKAKITFEVILSKDTYPKPNEITVSGTLTTEQFIALQNYFTHDLGIPKENQRWKIT